MKIRIFLVVLVLLIAVGVASFFGADEPIVLHESKDVIAQAISITEPLEIPTNEIHTSYNIPQSSFAITGEVENKDAGKKDDICKMFQADERDNLVLNESTRLNIEKLYALNTPEELESKLQKLSTVLPSTAHRQLINLIDYFDKYTMASKQIYPPDEVPANVENALDQLGSLHSLRVTHFGFEVARVFFAEEENLSRQLLEVTAQAGRWDDENIGI